MRSGIGYHLGLVVLSLGMGWWFVHGSGLCCWVRIRVGCQMQGKGLILVNNYLSNFRNCLQRLKNETLPDRCALVEKQRGGFRAVPAKEPLGDPVP